jgi:hypothetical protein
MVWVVPFDLTVHSVAVTIQMDPPRWPRDTLCPQKLALNFVDKRRSPVGIVCLRTKGHRVCLFCYYPEAIRWLLVLKYAITYVRKFHLIIVLAQPLEVSWRATTWKKRVVAPGWKTDINGRGDPSPTNGDFAVVVVRMRIKSHGVCLFVFYYKMCNLRQFSTT